MVDEETIYDEELSDDLLPTDTSEGGNGELYEHFRVTVDKGQVPARIDKFLLNACNTQVVTVFRKLQRQVLSM